MFSTRTWSNGPEDCKVEANVLCFHVVILLHLSQIGTCLFVCYFLFKDLWLKKERFTLYSHRRSQDFGTRAKR